MRDIAQKRTADLIDELVIVNIKIFMLEDELTKTNDTYRAGENAKKSRALNIQRSQLRNAIAARLDPGSLDDVKVS